MVAAMVTRRTALPAMSFTDFGMLLRVLRHRARLTQRQLGIAVGYSEAQISRLEQGRRRPDPAVVAALFLPALRLAAEPELAARLHELAVAARGGMAPGTASPPATPETVPGARAADLAAIPSLPSHHVERAGALGELHELIAADRCVVMSGLPGVGKTSLAAALARERSPDGAVCWVTLTAGITTPAEAVIRLLARFLVRHGHDEAAPVSDQGQVEHPLPLDEQLYLITRALSQAGALVCLDNAHLLRDEPQTQMVIEHLAGSSPASFLAASREDLPLAGFAPFRLGGLASRRGTRAGRRAGRPADVWSAHRHPDQADGRQPDADPAGARPAAPGRPRRSHAGRAPRGGTQGGLPTCCGPRWATSAGRAAG